MLNIQLKAISQPEAIYLIEVWERLVKLHPAEANLARR